MLLGYSATRLLGDSAARRLGGSAARRLGGSAARQLGSSAARELLSGRLAAQLRLPQTRAHALQPSSDRCQVTGISG